MRKTIRRAAVLSAALGLVCSTAVGAWALTVNQPLSGSYSVVGDSSGNPVPFTITAYGFTPNESVFVQQCDGVPSSTLGYSASEHCDIASGNSPTHATAAGIATFPASDSSLRLNVFKGESPQSRFNCLSPNQAPMHGVNGLADWRNCQVRVSADTPGDTSNQQFFTLVLPDGVTPACRIGASGTKFPGLVKIGPGLTSTASAKPNTQVQLSASIDNCTNFGAIATKYPVSAGQVKLALKSGPGGSCANFEAGSPSSSVLKIKWQGIKPKNGKLSTAETDTTSVASITQGALDPFSLHVVSGPFAAGAFAGKHLEFDVFVDQSLATISGACATKVGLKSLNFTGVQGTSTLTVH